MKRTLLITISIIALSSPSAASDPTCTNPDGEPGVIFFNSLHGVFQGCTPSGWYAFHAPSCPQADACDAPGAFAFAENTNVPLSSIVLSDIVQISDLDRPASITISGDGSPEYRICDASDCSSEVIAWGSSQESIADGQYLQLRLTSSDTEATMLSATATVNGAGAQWDVTTEAASPPVIQTCDNVGDICPDGSVFAGLSPSNGGKIYTSPQDGAPGGGTEAAQGSAITLCTSMNAYGSTNWKLPDISELRVLHDNRTAIGNFEYAEYYWSSTATNMYGIPIGTNKLFDESGYELETSTSSIERFRCIRQ